VEILLVEDNAGDAVLIRQVLADAAVPVNFHIARDGEQALFDVEGPSLQARPDHFGSQPSTNSGGGAARDLESGESPGGCVQLLVERCRVSAGVGTRGARICPKTHQYR